MALEPLTPHELTLLLTETDLAFDGDSNRHAKSIFKKNSASAAHELTRIALLDPDSRLRFAASKYIVERNLGILSAKGNDDSPIGDLFDKIEAEMANKETE